MDFAQGIDADIEEVQSTTTVKNTTITSITVTDSQEQQIDSVSVSSEERQLTMDPPSPILPPPPGSISPPRFLNEDFDIRDDEDLPSNLSASELLIEPTSASAAAARAEESSAEDDDDEEEEQNTVVVNKVKFHGLDSLTSDMAATLQSMISEEIEETIPRDDEAEKVVQWSSDTITSPPPPVWRQQQQDQEAAVVGSVDEEDEEESSPNSQSPQQVHKIISPPPPPAAEEEDDEDQYSTSRADKL